MNCLIEKEGQVYIKGFESIIGQMVEITLHKESLSFVLPKHVSTGKCIHFTEEILNKPVIKELLDKYHVFDSEFILSNGMYIQIGIN